jgi:AraC-like DNA-binding protein
VAAAVKVVSSYTISASVARSLVHMMNALGLRTEELLAANQIAPADLDDLHARLPSEVVYRLFEDAARMSGEPDLALRAAQRVPTGTLGVLAYAVQASATLGDAYRCLCRFYRLVMDVAQLDLVEGGDCARLVLRLPNPTREIFRQVAEGSLAAWLRRGRELTGVEWKPRVVRFRHRRPENIDAHRDFFRAPIEFDQTIDELELDQSLLALPTITSEPALARILDRYAGELLERLPPMNDFSGSVRQFVVSSLREGEPTLDKIATHFGTSPRSFQRRLAEEGLNLRQVIDDCRRELAYRYLTQPEISIAEISFLLGFDAVTSFHRRFRRWTGVSPAQYREKAVG